MKGLLLMRDLIYFLSIFLYAECAKEEVMDLSLNGRKSRISKRDNFLLDNLREDHCVNKFEGSARTVILAKESQNNGAVFLNETETLGFKGCLKACCDSKACNAAVWDMKTNICYLFDCGPRSDFKCFFDSHNMFTSGVLTTDRDELLPPTDWEDHRSHLQSLGKRRNSNTVVETFTNTQRECGRFQFKCHSGECIAVYDVCNGIPQCTDGSDEDADQCPKGTTTVVPSTKKPQSLSTTGGIPKDFRKTQWGREGERYHGPVSPFQHKNNGIQLLSPYVYQPPIIQPYGYNYYEPPSQPGQKQELPPSLSTSQDNAKRPKENPLTPVKNVSSTDKTIVPRKKTPTDISGPLKTDDTPDKTEQIKISLLKGLSFEDFSMETPTAAIFTLIIGMTLSLILAIVLGCRIRYKRNFAGGKRNLTTDADGDYLVNGMYL